MIIRCTNCGRAVSNEVPDTTVIKAWIECQECIDKEEDMNKLQEEMNETSKDTIDLTVH